MTDNPNLWEVRELPDGLTLEPWRGGNPALVLIQGKDRVRLDLAHVKGVVAALVDGAVDLVEVLAAGEVYHARPDALADRGGGGGPGGFCLPPGAAILGSFEAQGAALPAGVLCLLHPPGWRRLHPP